MSDAQEVAAAAVRGAPPAAYLAATKVMGLTVSDWITVLTLAYMVLLILGQVYPTWRRDLLATLRELRLFLGLALAAWWSRRRG